MSKGKGSLAIGTTLVLIGALLIIAPSGAVLVKLAVQFWPLLLIGLGLYRVAGFLRRNRPRTPTGGALLAGIGALFLINNLSSGLNAFQVYGRYWPVLLAVFALGELIFQYSHRNTGAAGPPVITVGKVFIVMALMVSGTLSARIANTNPNFFSSVALPEFLSHFRDAAFGQEFVYAEPPQVFSLTGTAQIVVRNSYGEVEVKAGSKPTLTVILQKAVRSYDEATAADIARQIQLRITPTSNGYSITTNRDELRHRFRTNLVIEVPAATTFQIENRYGQVTLAEVQGDQLINNAHGAVAVSDITGKLQIINAHGEITARRVSSLEIDTHHGAVKASDIAEQVQLKAQFAEITLRNIGGAVKVSNGHGDINLVNIGQRVLVEANHSDVTGQNWQSDGQVTTSHARVNISQVKGALTITAPHTRIEATEITGALAIREGAHARLTIRRIKGPVEISAEHSSVTAEDLQSPVTIQTSHGKVSVTNFYSSLVCSTSYEEAVFSPAVIAGDLTVSNDRGTIRLNVPQSANFRLEASATRSRVQTKGLANQLKFEQNLKEYVAGTVGQGGPRVSLSTAYDRIVIQGSR